MTPATFMRWLNAEEKKPKGAKSERKPGRPRTPDEVRDLVVKLAKGQAGDTGAFAARDKRPAAGTGND